MIRLIAIIFLIALAFLLIRYRTNQNIQKGVVITLISAFVIYATVVVVSELIR